MPRAEVFSSANIAGLMESNPFLKLFAKQDWHEYLELIAKAYDLLDEQSGRIEAQSLDSLIDAFYFSETPAYIVQKKHNFITMAVAELGVLKDTHDLAGNRYFEPTRHGNQLLKTCETLILNRKQFTGSGADTLIGSLNSMLDNANELTLDEAIIHHQEAIKKYLDDIQLIQEKGVRTSKMLAPGFSKEELFTRADEAASHILAASEDIKNSVSNVRKALVTNYHRDGFSAGHAIAYVADFYSALRETPEYASYTQAKDILSYIEGLGGRYRYKDINQLLHLLSIKGHLPQESLTRSSLPSFPRRFQSIVRNIEEKVEEQIQLLRTQVYYVMTGNSRHLQEELAELMGVTLKAGPQAQELFEAQPYQIPDGLDLTIGALAAHSFEIDQRIPTQAIELNSLSIEERRALAEALRKAEEATVRKVIDRLKAELSRKGKILLSEYPIQMGIVEYYVLANVAYFHPSIASVDAGSTALAFKTHNTNVVIENATNKLLYFT